MSLPLNVQVAKLAATYKQLPAKDQDFAYSLLSSFTKYGSLSDKQAYWVGKLLDRLPETTAPVAPMVIPAEVESGTLYWIRDGKVVAKPAPVAAPVEAPKAEPNTVPVGDFHKVVGMFESAHSHQLKKPKISMKAHGFTLNLSPYKGGVKVTHGANFGTWCGTVDADGNYVMPMYVQNNPELKAVILSVLEQMAADPVATTAKFGKMSGQCCFCKHPLTDGTSVKLGYGPVCAKKWGLPH